MKIDLVEAVIAFMIFVCAIFFIGSPDIADAIICNLMDTCSQFEKVE